MCETKGFAEPGPEETRDFEFAAHTRYLDIKLNRVVNWAIVTFGNALDFECDKIKLSREIAREKGIPMQAIYNAIESLKSALSDLGPEAGLGTYQVTRESDLGNMVTVFLDFVSDRGKKVQVQLKTAVMEGWDGRN
jgi:hypothetical protein